MQTLKLCRHGEPGILCNAKRDGERDLNCAWAYPKTQNRKKSEGNGQLLHVSGYWGANTIHTKPLNMWLVEQRAKHCSKNSVLFDYIMVMREKYQTLPAYISFCSGVGEPGNEAKYSEGLGDFFTCSNLR